MARADRSGPDADPPGDQPGQTSQPPPDLLTLSARKLVEQVRNRGGGPASRHGRTPTAGPSLRNRLRAGVTAATAPVREALHPLKPLARGGRRIARFARARWSGSSPQQRKAMLFLVVLAVVVIGMLPYGPLALLLSLMGLAAYLGRERTPRAADPPEVASKLGAVYNGLVPYLVDDHDANRLFAPDGDYRRAFTHWRFDEYGQVSELELRYSPFFRDSEPDCRAKVEHVIECKIGRDNSFTFDWDQEDNRLAVTVSPPR